MVESSIKQQNLSNSLMIENNFTKNNFMTESNYSKTKRGKLSGSVNNEFRIEKEKENNQLSNIKESIEREKSSKIDKNENSDEIKSESDNKNKNKKTNLGVIGNIRDLDNFDDLFK